MSTSNQPCTLAHTSPCEPRPYTKRVFVRRFNPQDRTYTMWQQGETLYYVADTNGHCIGQKVKVSMSTDVNFADPQLFFACRLELLQLTNDNFVFKDLYHITVAGQTVWVPARSINHKAAHSVKVLAGHYSRMTFDNVLLSHPLVPGKVQLLLSQGASVDIDALRELERKGDLGWKLSMIDL